LFKKVKNVTNIINLLILYIGIKCDLYGRKKQTRLLIVMTMKEKCQKVPDCILSSLINCFLQIICGLLALERRWVRREFGMRLRQMTLLTGTLVLVWKTKRKPQPRSYLWNVRNIEMGRGRVWPALSRVCRFRGRVVYWLNNCWSFSRCSQPCEISVAETAYQNIDCSTVQANWSSRPTLHDIDRTDRHATSLVHKFVSSYAFSLCMDICRQPCSPYLEIEWPWSEVEKCSHI
jgi:hypothetical protein